MEMEGRVRFVDECTTEGLSLDSIEVPRLLVPFFSC